MGESPDKIETQSSNVPFTLDTVHMYLDKVYLEVY